MLIIYTGRGLVVPLATFFGSLVSEIVWENVKNDQTYYQVHGLPLALALAAAAFLSYLAHRTAYKAVVDDDGRVISRPIPKWMDHTFLFIDLRAWAVLLVCFSLYTLIGRGF